MAPDDFLGNVSNLDRSFPVRGPRWLGFSVTFIRIQKIARGPSTFLGFCCWSFWMGDSWFLLLVVADGSLGNY